MNRRTLLAALAALAAPIPVASASAAKHSITIDVVADSAAMQTLAAEMLPLLETVPVGSRHRVLECLFGEFGRLCRCEFVPAAGAGGRVSRLQLLLPSADELFAAALRAGEVNRADLVHGGHRGE